MLDIEANLSKSLIHKDVFRYGLDVNRDQIIIWEIADSAVSRKNIRPGFLFKEVCGSNFILLDLNVSKKTSIVNLIYKPQNTKIDPNSNLYFKFIDGTIIKLAQNEYSVVSKNKSLLKYHISKECIETLSSKQLKSIYIQIRDDSIRNYFSCNFHFPFTAYANIYKEILTNILKIYDDIPSILPNVQIMSSTNIDDEKINETNLSIDGNKDESLIEEKCYVYLMHDTSNNYYKIGESKTPQYREKTLQSEKPSIELLCAKHYPNKKIAHAIEQALHKAYSSKRIRGEWFQQDSSDIKVLMETLK